MGISNQEVQGYFFTGGRFEQTIVTDFEQTVVTDYSCGNVSMFEEGVYKEKGSRLCHWRKYKKLPYLV